jgi:hypothetical protein
MIYPLHIICKGILLQLPDRNKFNGVIMDKKMKNLREHFGSYAKLAKALGISRQAINYWRVHGKIPAGAAISIERLTEGTIKAVDLA